MMKDHRHGVVAYDCDHPDCKAAVTRCRKSYELRKLEGTSVFVDAGPVRMHILTLVGRGWSLRSIGGAAGVKAGTICHLRNQRQTRLRPDVARRILEVDPMQVPSKPSEQTQEPFVSRVGVVRRIQALMTLGWTHEAMLGRSGLRTHALLAQQGTWVTRGTHDRVAALYRELSAKPGPSERTRRRAAARGYAGPLDWDDIDLDEAPEVVVDLVESGAPGDWDDTVDDAMVELILARRPRPRKATNAEGQVAYDRLRGAGVSTTRIENDYGLKPDRYRRVDREEPAA